MRKAKRIYDDRCTGISPLVDNRSIKPPTHPKSAELIYPVLKRELRLTARKGNLMIERHRKVYVYTRQRCAGDLTCSSRMVYNHSPDGNNGD